MIKKIRVSGIEASAFKVFDKVSVDFPERATYVVARNGQGKSTVLQAITWALQGLDTFGSKMDPFKIGVPASTWVRVEMEVDGNYQNFRRIIKMNAKGKTETTVNDSLDLDKEIFYALTNPRYIQDQDPKNIKNIVAKVIDIPVTIMECGMDASLVSAATPYVGATSYEKIAAVEGAIKAVSAEIKSIEKEILIQNGKAEGVKTIISLFEENGITPDEETLEILALTTDGAASIIAVKESEIDAKKAFSKVLNAYRTAAYEALAKELNDKMTNVQIKLSENGKEVFIVTYNGKNVRACSNSEQLKAGLEMIDAISGITGYSYPCLVDNAECAINIDINEYPHIKQFVFAMVADENLSIWDGSMLQDIETGTLLPRTKEQLMPSITLLQGWGATVG